MSNEHKNKKTHTTPLSEVSEGRHEISRKIAKRLREHGLWNKLCEAALWQPPAFNGIPMRSEDSAIWQILDHLGEVRHGMTSKRDEFVEVVGKPSIKEALECATRKHLSMESWCVWKRLLSIPLTDQDRNPSLFADGWNLRFNSGETHNAPRTPGEIPTTLPDEKIMWGYDHLKGDVYPVPY